MEARAGELYADDCFALGFARLDVDDAADGGKVDVAATALAGHGDGDFDAGAELDFAGNGEGGAGAADVFGLGGFFEDGAVAVGAADLKREMDGNAALGAAFEGGSCSTS